jgi:hypothetical protein
MAHLIAMEKRIAMLQAIVERVFDALHIGATEPSDKATADGRDGAGGHSDADPAREPELCGSIGVHDERTPLVFTRRELDPAPRRDHR